MTQHQAARDRAEAEIQKLVEQIGPLKTYIDKGQAKDARAALDNYVALRASPEIGEMIQEFERTGKLPERKGSEPNTDDDEYQTPEERELKALRVELADVRQATNANTLASGKETFTKHMEEVFREFQFAPEDAEKSRAAMVSQLEAWQNQGPKGMAAIESVGTQNGYKTVRGIMLADIPREAFARASANVALRKSQGLSDLSTDGPSGSLSTGREAPPDFAGDFIAASKWAKANPDGHDSY